jgi:hypothetical protein
MTDTNANSSRHHRRRLAAPRNRAWRSVDSSRALRLPWIDSIHLRVWREGKDWSEHPLGATDVVDRKAVICQALIDADYRKRAESAAALTVLRGLVRKA